MNNNPSNTEKMVAAGFAELERRGFRVGASDLGMDDLLAVFKAMQAEQPQGEPAAWINPDVLATLHDSAGCYAFGTQNKDRTLIPLFTHADPGQIERLRAELGEAKGEYDRSANKVSLLQDQLVERDALLREIRRSCHGRHVALSDAAIGAPPPPADATHYYPGETGDRKYRRQIEGVWHEFCGQWLPLDTQDMAHLYIEIDRTKAALSVSAEPAPSAHLVVVPNGYCLMPTRLTAENGAKGLLSGEFNVSREHDCHECAETDDDDCEVCGGHGSYTQKTPVGWDVIKDIYQKAVGGLSLKGPGQAPVTPVKGDEHE